eukprot:scaffold126769_cov48-Phaeocystis_antarctica.AAC.1
MGWLPLPCPKLELGRGARWPARSPWPATPSSVPLPCAQCHGRHPHWDDGVRLPGRAGHRRELLRAGDEIGPRVRRAQRPPHRVALHTALAQCRSHTAGASRPARGMRVAPFWGRGAERVDCAGSEGGAGRVQGARGGGAASPASPR